MNNYLDSFSELKTRFGIKTKLIEEKLPTEILLIEELLYSSFNLDLTISEINRKTEKAMEETLSVIYILFAGTNHFLKGSFDLALIGLNRPSHSLLRTVYENILHIYLLHLTEGREAQLYVKNMLGNLSEEEKSEYKEKYRYLSLKKVVHPLYTAKSKETHLNFYGEISKNSHASIKSAFYDMEIAYQPSKEVLELILLLGVANLIAINDVFFKILSETDHQVYSKLCERISEHVGGGPDLIPNSPTLTRHPNILSLKSWIYNR
ncbi:hypothetical protein BMS3Abin16_00064 [archaeon BMS3Abin16]|nr:hypothetical protein BMS3Abin16_00064 [archaeon BMS3Abin16]